MKLYQDRRRLFPNPETHSIDGIVAMGDNLTVGTLFEAYSFGIFPWPHDDLPLLWYSPDPRGVLRFDHLHIPKSLKKFMRRTNWRVTFNQAFHDVMVKCSLVPRPGQDGTWITAQMIRAYEDFHEAGYAHSVEVWDDQQLVGGLYGVYVGGVFAGESMFYEKSNASKVALITLIEKLRKSGHTWMDTQMLTPVTEQLGAEYVPRKEYLAWLEEAKKKAKPLRFD